MNKIRLIALVIAVTMLAMCMASCGSTAEKVAVNCNVSVMLNGEEVFGPVNYTVNGTTETPPTVLQAVREAFTVYEIPYEVDENGLSITSITIDGTEYAKKADDTNIYMWYYTADGIEPEEGRAGTNLIVEGQTITFHYLVEPIDPENVEGEDGGR